MNSKQLIAFVPLSIALAFAVIGAILDRKRKKKFDYEMNREGDRSFILETTKYEIYRKGMITLAVLSSFILVGLILIFIVIKNETVKYILYGTVFITFFLLASLRLLPSFIFKCPRCMGRKMQYLSKVILSSTVTTKGRKKAYFRCKTCGFEVIEDVEIAKHTINSAS